MLDKMLDRSKACPMGEFLGVVITPGVGALVKKMGFWRKGFATAAEPSVAYVHVLCWAFLRVTYRPAGSVIETTRTKTSTPLRRKGALSPLHRDPLMARGPAEHSGSFPFLVDAQFQASFVQELVRLLVSCPVSVGVGAFQLHGYATSSSSPVGLPKWFLGGQVPVKDGCQFTEVEQVEPFEWDLCFAPPSLFPGVF